MALSKTQTEQILRDLKELTPEQQSQYLDGLEKQFGSVEPSAPAEAPVDPNAGPAWLRAAEAGMSGEGGAFADPNATPEDMAGRAASMANVSVLAAGPGAASALGRVPGMVGNAARYAIANPTKTGFAIGAAPRLLRGDVLGAAEQGTLFALLGAGGKAARVLKKLGGWGVAEAEVAASETAAAKAAAAKLSAPRSTTGVVPASVSATRTTGSGVPMLLKKGMEDFAKRRAETEAAKAVVKEAAPVVAKATQATAPGSFENLVLRLKDMASTKEGRKMVLDYIKTQPPEVAKQLREVLGPAVRHRVGVK